MLQHFPGDVQAQILRVDHAAHEAEAVGQQIGAVFHDHHAGGVQLQALLEVLGVEIIRCFRGDEQQRLVCDRALDVRVNDGQRIFKVKEFLFIEIVVFLVGDVLFIPVPDRDHGVERLDLGIGLIFGLVAVFRALLHAALFNRHADGVADIIGIFAHERLQLPCLQETGILLVVRVGLQLHDHVRTGGSALTRGHGIAVRTLGLPFPCFVRAVFLRNDGHLVRDHECRIEAHAELADDIGVSGLVLVERLLELQTAGAADRAEVVFHLVLVHTDAVVADGQRAGGLVGLEFDRKIAAAEADFLVGQRLIGQLVDGVGGVGNDFTQENFLMRVNGVYHEIQQTLGFRLELFLCHSKCHVLCRLALMLSEC